jgi:toxin ParE1/3/4
VAYRLGVAARQDVIDIYLRSEEMFGEAQADRYLTDLYATFAFLGDNPSAARVRREFEPEVRIHPHKAHVIIYLVDQDGVLVVRIRHGREDWTSSPLGD